MIFTHTYFYDIKPYHQCRSILCFLLLGPKGEIGDRGPPGVGLDGPTGRPGREGKMHASL